jgi:hypothetical protein
MSAEEISNHIVDSIISGWDLISRKFTSRQECETYFKKTIEKHTAQQTKELRDENERLKEQINSTGLVPEVEGKIYMQKRVKELCSRAYSDGYTDALAGNSLHPENWINGNI